MGFRNETGIANAFVPSKTFECYRLVITREGYLKIHDRLQHVADVISVYALRIEVAALQTISHDFHRREIQKFQAVWAEPVP